MQGLQKVRKHLESQVIVRSSTMEALEPPTAQSPQQTLECTAGTEQDSSVMDMNRACGTCCYQTC